MPAETKLPYTLHSRAFALRLSLRLCLCPCLSCACACACPDHSLSSWCVPPRNSAEWPNWLWLPVGPTQLLPASHDWIHTRLGERRSAYLLAGRDSAIGALGAFGAIGAFGAFGAVGAIGAVGE
jgi:hypothetical protein